jgi:predicted DNA-binding transcriptional regulator AlpA
MQNSTASAPQASPNILLTPEKICKFLSISRRTLRYWVHKNVFPQPLRIGPDGRILRWHPADLLHYLKMTRGHVGAQAAMQEFQGGAGKEEPRPEARAVP